MAKKRPQEKKIRVLVVDDHPIVRQGLSLLLNQEEDLMTCGEAGDAQQAMTAIADLRPDIAIIDISLKGMDGLELIKNIKEQYAWLPVLALSMHDESLYAERALRAGAMGYLMKQEATDKVIEAIRRILSGNVHLSDKMATAILHRFTAGPPGTGGSPINSLSDRELEVFRLIGQGNATRKIAKELCLSVKTIESYREQIKKKMGLKNATELMQQAIRSEQNEIAG